MPAGVRACRVFLGTGNAAGILSHSPVLSLLPQPCGFLAVREEYQTLALELCANDAIRVGRADTASGLINGHLVVRPPAPRFSALRVLAGLYLAKKGGSTLRSPVHCNRNPAQAEEPTLRSTPGRHVHNLDIQPYALKQICYHTRRRKKQQSAMLSAANFEGSTPRTTYTGMPPLPLAPALSES